MNRDEALRILLSAGPSISPDSPPYMTALMRQAAELIASEVMRTSEGPLKDSSLDNPPQKNGAGLVRVPMLTPLTKAQL